MPVIDLTKIHTFQGRVALILDTALASGASNILHPQMNLDEKCSWVTELTGVHTALGTFQLRGGMTEGTKAVLGTTTYVNITGETNDIFKHASLFQIYPNMDVAWNGLTGASPRMRVWLMF